MHYSQKMDLWTEKQHVGSKYAFFLDSSNFVMETCWCYGMNSSEIWVLTEKPEKRGKMWDKKIYARIEGTLTGNEKIN